MERHQKGIKACGNWLAYCLELGFPKSSLDALEALWWKHHDGYGNVLPPSQQANAAHGEQRCRCAGEPFTINGLCHVCWHPRL